MARRERAQRDRRLEKPAIEVLTATGEREATIAATEQGAGAALQAMITDESLTVFEAVQGAPALSVIGKRPSFAIQPQAHHSRGDSSWGVVVFRWFMTPKTQVHCRRVGACLPVVADVKHMSRLDQRASRSNFDGPHRDHFRCDQHGFATSAELTRTSKSCASRR
jgi:hypothetical protein